MNSIILAAAIRYMMPLMLLTAFFLLLVGHNAPGGGFVGGLVAACAYALFSIAHGWDAARKSLRVDPRTLIAVGLATALGSAVVSLLGGEAFMTGTWIPFPLPGLGKVGTPTIFDTGVFLTVVGVVLTIVFELEED